MKRTGLTMIDSMIINVMMTSMMTNSEPLDRLLVVGASVGIPSGRWVQNEFVASVG
jgi:hypothetical protein